MTTQHFKVPTYPQYPGLIQEQNQILMTWLNYGALPGPWGLHFNQLSPSQGRGEPFSDFVGFGDPNVTVPRGHISLPWGCTWILALRWLMGNWISCHLMVCLWRKTESSPLLKLVLLSNLSACSWVRGCWLAFLPCLRKSYGAATR